MSLALLIDNPEDVLSTPPTEPKLYHRNPDDFGGLLTLAEVDGLIDADCLALRNIALLKDGKPVETYLYADGDMPMPGYLRRFLDEGGTLSLRGLERFKPAIARLHRAVAHETGQLVHVNGYLTPAGEQGLRYHYDPYVTLIVQLSGRKAWPLHRPFVENPVREYGSYHTRGFTGEEWSFLAHTPPVETYTLGPGDVFWLPRGFVHSPYTVGAGPSLHLTVALKERTWQWAAAQMARDVVHQALADPAMREAVPATEVVGDARRVVRETRAYLIGSLLKLDLGDAAESLRRHARQPG